MNTYDFVHLALCLLGEEVQGRTKLQKQVYFLAKLAGVEEDLGYSAHFYGPYSAEVADAVKRLESLDFVEHHVASGGSYDQRGFEVARHDYKLTDSGRKLAQAKLDKLNPAERNRLERGVQAIKSGKDLDYMQLSVAAKALHILEKSGKPMTPGEVAEAAKNFNWDIQPEQVSAVSGYLDELGLVGSGK